MHALRRVRAIATILWSAALVHAQSVSISIPSARCVSPTSVWSDTTGVFASCAGSGVVQYSYDLLTVSTLITSAQCPSASTVQRNSATGVIYAVCQGGAATDRTLVSVAAAGSPLTTLLTYAQCQVTSMYLDATANLVYVGAYSRHESREERRKGGEGACRWRASQVRDLYLIPLAAFHLLLLHALSRLLQGARTPARATSSFR
jgi:hypothetical protein